MFKTEFEFTLPNGLIGDDGALHRRGVMRLAMARDELEPLGDPRVKANEAYLGVLLLSRVLVRLGSVAPVTTDWVERLFAADFAFLQDLYVRINDPSSIVETECPKCGERFVLDLTADADLEEAV
jgi:hypothetical protein